MKWRLGIFVLASALGGFAWLRQTPSRTKTPPFPSAEATVHHGKVALAAGDSFNWRQVESEDYHVYVRNLQSIGCPEETIRDIVIADVTKLYTARRKMLLAPGPWKYWRPDEPEPGQLSRAHRDQIEALEVERRQLLVSLLGPKGEEELVRLESGSAPERLEFLPSEKRLPVLKFENLFKARRQALFGEAETYGTSPDRLRLKDLYSKRESDLKQLLSPEELFEYQLRSDESAERLRHDLVGFNPTEAEFREIFRIRKAHETQFNFIDPADEGLVALANADQGRGEDEISAYLGLPRYHELRRGADSRFRELYSLTQQFDLPQETAGLLYDRHAQIQAEITRIERDPSLSPEQKQEAVNQFQKELLNTLRQSLGVEAFAKFQAREIDSLLGN